MPRYAILQGVGHPSRPNFTDIGGSIEDWPEMWRKWPYLVIQAPSGQLAILPPPSGAGAVAGLTGRLNTEKGVSSKYYAYQGLLCHKPIAFKHNSIVHWWKRSLNEVESDPGWRWHPYENVAHKNGLGTAFDTNFDYDNHVIFDGYHNTFLLFGLSTVEIGCGGVAVQDGVVWGHSTDLPLYEHGNWTGQQPFQVSAGHYFPGLRMFGNPGDQADEKFRIPDSNIQGIGAGIQAGIDYRATETADPSDESHMICDMVEYQGTIYYCSQTAVWAQRIGMKGAFIYAAYFVNDQASVGGDSSLGLAALTTRGSQAEFNDPQMRTFAKHQGSLYMLQNDGKVFTVDPHSITKIADLSTDIVNSPFGSGIKGGSLQETPLVGVGLFPSPRAFRPFMTSFNKQLHAFLTYEIDQTTFGIQTGTSVASPSFGSVVQGVGWFTSHDGVNWSDRTKQFASTPCQSGIITPSGNTVLVSEWNAITSPFIHSALQNTNYPSGYGNGAPLTAGTELQPQGYRQATGQPTETTSRHQNDVDSGKAFMGGDTDRLPIWTSGNVVDPPGTTFDALQLKLDYGSISGFLYPTIVNYPSGYNYINPNQLDGSTVPTNLLPAVSGGVWGPFQQGKKGWDYTGVTGKHVTGYVNMNDPETNNYTLKLCFSDNPPSTDQLSEKQVASHFFELTRASGWKQVNYVHWGGAFCGGYQSVDLYDPEVIIASGTIADPNPWIDPYREMARIKFQLLDWGYWDNVYCRFEYTTDDGLNWKHATISSGSLGPLSTNTKQADPSGILGGNHEIWWDYKADLGRHTWYPNVRVRMRAEVQ